MSLGSIFGKAWDYLCGSPAAHQAALVTVEIVEDALDEVTDRFLVHGSPIDIAFDAMVHEMALAIVAKMGQPAK